MPKIFKRHCDICGRYYEGQGANYCSHSCSSLAREQMRRELSYVKKRFWTQVSIHDLITCWEWQGRKRRFGYGDFIINGKSKAAHRVAWMLVNGNIPPSMCVLHHCDNPPCVNPSHLFLGTKTDNSRDRDNKDRQAKGSRNGSSKLSEADVILMRKLAEDGVPRKKLADKFGIAHSTTCQILRREIWKHI